jgi:hypothetical protein
VDTTLPTAPGFSTAARLAGVSFFGRKMCSVLVVIADVLAHQPFEMPFIPYDHVIPQVSSTVTNPAFGDFILAWTAKAGSLRCDAKALHRFDNFLIKIVARSKIR